jgi:hypothetical protein
MVKLTPEQVISIARAYNTGIDVSEIIDDMTAPVSKNVSFWLEEDATAVLSSLYRAGHDDEYVIKFIHEHGFENSEEVFEELMKVDEFRVLRHKGKEWGNNIVENALFMRAKGYFVTEYKDILVDGDVRALSTKKYIEPNLTASKMWLETQASKKWGPKLEEGNDGQVKTIMKTLAEADTVHAIEKLRKMKAKGIYTDEEMIEYEVDYLGVKYDDVINDLYSDVSAEELSKR